MFRVLSFTGKGKAKFSRIHPKDIKKGGKIPISRESKFWKEYISYVYIKSNTSA